MSIAENDSINVPRRRRRQNGHRLLWLVFGVSGLAILSMGIYKARFSTTPFLMEKATWAAPMDRYSGYRWETEREVTLFQHQRAGTAAFQWDTKTHFMKPLSLNKRFEAEAQQQEPSLSVQQREGELLVIKAWNNAREYRQDASMSKPDHVWKLQIVPGASVETGSCVTSHDGSQVAYIAYMKPVNFWTPLRNRFWPEPISGRVESGAIPACNVDGGDTRIIGYVADFMPASHSRYSKSGTTFSLQQLQWLPGDKHLSFAYGDGLYTVPVD